MSLKKKKQMRMKNGLVNEDGILYIDIPKQEKIVSKSRTIEIK